MRMKHPPVVCRRLIFLAAAIGSWAAVDRAVGAADASAMRVTRTERRSGGDGDWSAKVHSSVVQRLTAAGRSEVRVWVFFADKGGAARKGAQAALAELEQTFNERALARRQLRRTRPGVVDELDLPVASAYVNAVAATGARVRVRSRWLNAVSVIATREQIAQVAALDFVEKIQPVRQGKKIAPVGVDETPWAGPTATAGAAGVFYGQSEAQLAQMNLIAVHGLGFTGAGVVVGILDTGFERSHVAFNEPGHPVQIVAEYDFVSDDGFTGFDPMDASGQHNHGTYILGTLGAYRPTELVGAAYDASFILCKTEDVGSETPVEEDNYVAGLEFIEMNGGDMATASLGYIDWYTQGDLDGLTAVTTVAVNIATANGVVCLNAAGNGGHDGNPATSQLIAPADAFEVITCGAVDEFGSIAGFSSDGPTADGRVKPEVLARGVNTRTVSATSSTNIIGVNGTSLSTPLAAGAVACLIQARPAWTVEQVRTYLMLTASDYVANDTFDGTFVRGYGIIDVLAALDQDCDANGANDETDILLGTHPDCDGNLIPDLCDLAAGNGSDCNSNGVPDECDIAGGAADCDGNGVPDTCQMGGGAADCNGNGTLDVCDLMGGGSLDCNGNGVPDECDLSGGSSADCNFNSVPDECDIAGGGSPDLNSNGVPDECEIEAPQAATAPHDVAKNRYLSLVPNNTGVMTALRVTLVQSDDFPAAEGLAAWVGAPSGGLAGLQCTAVYRDWSLDGVEIHVGGAMIVPVAAYEVRAIRAGFPENNPLSYSAALEVSTIARPTGGKMWGDTVGQFDGSTWSGPNEIVNANDFIAALQRFQAMPGAPALPQVDVHDRVPNGVLNFSDIQVLIQAFQGQDYPFGSPDSCP